jgi:signal transduction histidine kinase
MSRASARLVELIGRGVPAQSVRLRLTALYGALFLLCGAGLLAITYLLVSRATQVSAVAASAPGGAARGAVVHTHLVDLHQLLEQSAIALAIMVIVAGVLGWVVAGRALSPLRQALARLEAGFEAQRRFAANASHELRTPLAMMRTTLDVAMAKPDGVPPQTTALDANLRLDLDRADRLLESFLALARAEHAGASDHPGPVRLDRLAADALAVRRERIAAAHIDVRASLHAVSVNGSETLLARMVDNVIENAVLHNKPGGFVDLACRAEQRVARLVVESGGAVLDERTVEQLAQPFRRAGADRTRSEPGFGLGLSIVAAVAAAHGGSLELRARPEGGLDVRIALPAATPVEIERVAV